MKPKIERGEICWVNLDPTRGAEIRKQRPCVVVSADAINRWRATPVIVPLSSSASDAPPVVVSVRSAGADSVAVIDQLRAVDRKRFVSSHGRLSPQDMAQIESAQTRVRTPLTVIAGGSVGLRAGSSYRIIWGELVHTFAPDPGWDFVQSINKVPMVRWSTPRPECLAVQKRD